MTAEAALGRSREIDFSIDEIFFSRTDEKGAIRAGNEALQRVTGFDWAELIGAPHQIVRNPDTPKSVFHLVWSRLQKGEKAIAYFKNRTKEGLPYWVLAFITPEEDGYVSVGVKPVSEVFGEVEALYDALQKEESEGGWSPEAQGHSRLLERLAEAGFEDYDVFSRRAAMAEAMERDSRRNRISDPVFVNLPTVSKTVSELSGKVEALADVFQRIRTTPVNLGIMANRIERSGGPISAISGIYSSMSAEIGDWLDGFLKSSEKAFDRMGRQASECLAIAAASDIANEMLANFETEDVGERGYDHYGEVVRLKRMARTSKREARTAVTSIRNDAMELQNAVHVLKRHVMSLSSTRVLCEIESAKLPQRSESLEGVVAQLAGFQKEIEELHKDIDEGTQSILTCLATGNAQSETEGREAA